ncbi:hypothetical protein EBU71_04835 [bacterium]|nr:hypothetical protein [Candidatus Elulimicrobium humile]
MEYLVGFFTCFVLTYIAVNLQKNNNILQEKNIKPIRYSQSHIHSLVLPLLPKNVKHKRGSRSQATKVNDQNHIRVIIMDNKAYWIKDNVFYTADMSMDGTVDKDTTSRVDTESMNKVQLDQMLFIVDKLTEGTFDDSGGTGN